MHSFRHGISFAPYRAAKSNPVFPSADVPIEALRPGSVTKSDATPKKWPQALAPRNIASLIRGLYGRVARELKVDPSYVSRVARQERRSVTIEAALRREIGRIITIVEANREQSRPGANLKRKPRPERTRAYWRRTAVIVSAAPARPVCDRCQPSVFRLSIPLSPARESNIQSKRNVSLRSQIPRFPAARPQRKLNLRPAGAFGKLGVYSLAESRPQSTFPLNRGEYS